MFPILEEVLASQGFLLYIVHHSTRSSKNGMSNMY